MGDANQEDIIDEQGPCNWSPEEWERRWKIATNPDEDDTQIEQYIFQFRACIQSNSDNTYLCVHSDQSVGINGEKDQPNTIFRVTHVFTPDKGYYQIVCQGGTCQNYILYVDGTKLKARPYCFKKDSLDGGRREPDKTLFKFQQYERGGFRITTSKGELKLSRSRANGPPNNILLSAEQSEDVILFDPTIKPVPETLK